MAITVGNWKYEERNTYPKSRLLDIYKSCFQDFMGADHLVPDKRQKFGLEASKTGDYAAGIGSVSALVRTSATFQINGYDIEEKDLYLMDISYINSEFRKNHARQVDGVLGTDFLDKYGAVIDYAQQRLYLRIRKQD
jgi:hypothetical protein